MKINEQVRQMRPARYTRSQVAVMLGKDLDTVRRWKREGIYAPSEHKTFGRLVVDLYSDEDVARMKDIAGRLRPGRKKTA